MITKKAGTDYPYVDFDTQALTLCTGCVSSEFHTNLTPGKMYGRINDSGWTIRGIVNEDYVYWVSEFEAFHPDFGRLYGDFEDAIYVESEEAFEHFWKHHEPEYWDYWDI